MRRALNLSVLVLVLVADAGCSAAIESQKQESLSREAPVPEVSQDGEVAEEEPAAVPALEAKRSGVSLAQYNRLENGMTFEEVSRILGSGGKELSSSEFGEGTEYHSVTTMVEWTGAADFSNMNAMFQNGEMVSKAQFGLE